jgi:hypothetical protein
MPKPKGHKIMKRTKENKIEVDMKEWMEIHKNENQTGKSHEM